MVCGEMNCIAQMCFVGADCMLGGVAWNVCLPCCDVLVFGVVVAMYVIVPPSHVNVLAIALSQHV